MTTYVVTGRRGADLPLHDLGHPSSTLATAEMLRAACQARGWLDVSIVDSSSDTPALEASTLECLDTADGALLSARDAASDIGLDASLHLTVGVPTNLLLEAHKWVWLPVRPVIAPNDRVHGDDGRAIHLIRTDSVTAYQHALERPICRRGRGPTIWDPANMWDLDERTMCPECARRAARSLPER